MEVGQNSGDSAKALTVTSAANVLEGLLSGKPEEKQPAETKPDKTPVEQPAAEEVEGDKPEATEEQSEQPDEDASETPEGEEEAEPEDQPAQPEKHRLKVNGEEIEATLDELKKGYSREQDYTRKAQKLAEDRRKHDAEAQPEREALRADRQRYATHITELENALRALAQEPDWETLRMQSPDLFADTWAAWNQHQKRIAQISEERTKAVAAVEKDFTTQQQTRLVAEHTKLLEAIPAWTDQAVAKKESDEMLAYGKTLGFSEDEVRGVSDHRALVVMRKAMLFDKAAKATAANAKTVQAKIDKVKVAAPGTGARGQGKVTDATRAKQRHAQVGTVDSGAAAIELMFGD